MNNLAAQLGRWQQEAQQEQAKREAKQMLVLQARCREMGLPDAYWSLFEVWRNKGYPDPGSIVLCEKDNCQHRERH